MHLTPKPGLVRMTHPDEPDTERYATPALFESYWAEQGWKTDDLQQVAEVPVDEDPPAEEQSAEEQSAEEQPPADEPAEAPAEKAPRSRTRKGANDG